jgi:hypothetical protein
MPAEAMEIDQGDTNQPDLRIGNTLPQPVGRLHFVLVHFVFACLDVDSNELVLFGRRQIGANLALDQRVPAAGERRSSAARPAGETSPSGKP